MVYRNIHGKIVNIYTTEISQTSEGYLSKNYNSKYIDPLSGKVISKINYFTDNFIPLYQNGPYVLSSRFIQNFTLIFRNLF